MPQPMAARLKSKVGLGVAVAGALGARTQTALREPERRRSVLDGEARQIRLS